MDKNVSLRSKYYKNSFYVYAERRNSLKNTYTQIQNLSYQTCNLYNVKKIFFLNLHFYVLYSWY